MEISKEQLEKTISMLEVDLEHMHRFMDNIPAPCLVYDNSGVISWANRPMLNLFFGTLDKPIFTAKAEVFGKHVKDVMPDYLWPYVLEKNAEVAASGKSQYEEWSDDVWVSCEWKCLRFPIGSCHVGVILFPKAEDDLQRCNDALKLERPKELWTQS